MRLSLPTGIDPFHATAVKNPFWMYGDWPAKSIAGSPRRS